MRILRLSVFTVLMVLTAGLLAVASANPVLQLDVFPRDVVNRTLSYQLSALPVAGVALLLTYAFAGDVRLRYLRLNRTGKMKPLLGRSGGGRWESDGWVIGAVMAVIAGTATFVQLHPGGFDVRWAYVVLALPLAATNAFTEEVVFRLSYVSVGAGETDSDTYGLVLGAVVFGVFHYWGVTPNGFSGAAMAAVLGFFLAKSIQETRGFFWAFSIHFVLNVVMMMLLLSSAG